MSNLVKCGEMNTGNGYADIMFDDITGDLVLMDDAAGNCIISEVAIEGISTVPEPNAIPNVCSYYGCKGAVLATNYLITFDDDFAYYRPYLDTQHPVRQVAYDICQSYDE